MTTKPAPKKRATKPAAKKAKPAPPPAAQEQQAPIDARAWPDSMTGTTTERITRHGIDAICADILSGKSLARICRDQGWPEATLHGWLSADPERSARVREARANSAEAYAGKAEDVLNDLMSSATPAEIARAKELAHHYRWMASKRNPKSFGEKVQVDATVNVQELDERELNGRIERLLGQLGISVAAGTTTE